MTRDPEGFPGLNPVWGHPLHTPEPRQSLSGHLGRIAYTNKKSHPKSPQVTPSHPLVGQDTDCGLHLLGIFFPPASTMYQLNSVRFSWPSEAVAVTSMSRRCAPTRSTSIAISVVDLVPRQKFLLIKLSFELVHGEEPSLTDVKLVEDHLDRLHAWPCYTVIQVVLVEARTHFFYIISKGSDRSRANSLISSSPSPFVSNS